MSYILGGMTNEHTVSLSTFSLYRITTSDGSPIGTWAAYTEAEALDAYARDAGYSSYTELTRSLRQTHGQDYDTTVHTAQLRGISLCRFQPLTDADAVWADADQTTVVADNGETGDRRVTLYRSQRVSFEVDQEPCDLLWLNTSGGNEWIAWLDDDRGELADEFRHQSDVEDILNGSPWLVEALRACGIELPTEELTHVVNWSDHSNGGDLRDLELEALTDAAQRYCENHSLPCARIKWLHWTPERNSGLEPGTYWGDSVDAATPGGAVDDLIGAAWEHAWSELPDALIRVVSEEMLSADVLGADEPIRDWSMTWSDCGVGRIEPDHGWAQSEQMDALRECLPAGDPWPDVVACYAKLAEVALDESLADIAEGDQS